MRSRLLSACNERKHPIRSASLILNKLEKQGIKPFPKEENSISFSNYNIRTQNFDNIQRTNQVEVAIVTVCLTRNHNECTGKYTNSEGEFLIKCECICHSANNRYSRTRRKTRSVFMNKTRK